MCKNTAAIIQKIKFPFQTVPYQLESIPWCELYTAVGAVKAGVCASSQEVVYFRLTISEKAALMAQELMFAGV